MSQSGMIINVVRFEYLNEINWAVVEGSMLRLIDRPYTTTAELLDDKDSILSLIKNKKGTLIPLSEVKLLSPVIGNRRVICQGANYTQHMKESGIDPDAKTYNMFFNKSSASICSASDDIVKPKHVNLLDYEIELGLVIGKPIDREVEVTNDNLWQYVAAIVITNDVSARDVQIPETQFFKGKSYRTFCPVGPYLCLVDQHSIKYLNELELTLSVNGEVRQKDSTKNWIYKPAETLTELSSFSNLETGDLVLTGTPNGCALRLPSPAVVKLFSLLPEAFRWKKFKQIQGKRTQYLKPGDEINAVIKSADNNVHLGQQCNRIVSA